MIERQAGEMEVFEVLEAGKCFPSQRRLLVLVESLLEQAMRTRMSTHLRSGMQATSIAVPMAKSFSYRVCDLIEVDCGAHATSCRFKHAYKPHFPVMMSFGRLALKTDCHIGMLMSVSAKVGSVACANQPFEITRTEETSAQSSLFGCS